MPIPDRFFERVFPGRNKNIDKQNQWNEISYLAEKDGVCECNKKKDQKAENQFLYKRCFLFSFVSHQALN